MTKMNSATKKFLAGMFAFATMAISANAMAANSNVDIGTAVNYQPLDGNRKSVTLEGNRNDVLLEVTQIKRAAIRDGALEAIFMEENVDNEKELKVTIFFEDPAPKKIGYPGFVKVIQYRGNADLVVQKAVEQENRGYDVLEFEECGYIDNPHGTIILGKQVQP